MQLKIAICDDTEYFRKMLQLKLSEIPELKYSEILTYKGSSDFLESLKTYKYDVVFMDIELEDKHSGLDCAVTCKLYCPASLIIYISSFESYFPQMVNCEPFGFIKKPFTDENLFKIINLAIKRINILNDSYTYIYKFKGSEYKLNLHNVLYFESHRRIIRANCLNGEYGEFYEKMDLLEEKVNNIYPYFLRPNKSFLLNYHYCTSVKANTVMIKEIDFRISSNYKNSFIENFCKIKGYS